MPANTETQVTSQLNVSLNSDVVKRIKKYAIEQQISIRLVMEKAVNLFFSNKPVKHQINLDEFLTNWLENKLNQIKQ